jgi:hypothetical protein
MTGCPQAHASHSMHNIVSCSNHTLEKQQCEKASCSSRAKVKILSQYATAQQTESIATAKMATLDTMRTMLKILCYLIFYNIFQKTFHIQGFAVKQKIISRFQSDIFLFYTHISKYSKQTI